jgi:hypothetical protein
MVISGVLIAPKSLELADIGKFTASNIAAPKKDREERQPS